MMQILQLTQAMTLEAAELFCQAYRNQRLAEPLLSVDMEDPQVVAGLLSGEMSQRSIAAVEDGRLVGYLGWYEVERFRGSARRGAYVPEWGHAAVDGRKDQIYRALYRQASRVWSEHSCNVHAITVMAQDVATRQAWFWNGFGLAVVDAIRTAAPLPDRPHVSLQIFRASTEHAAILAALDTEHRQHYSAPPIYMPSTPGESAADFAAFLSQPPNNVWLAMDHAQPAGFMRFEGGNFEGVAVFKHLRTIKITGAYVRPAYRRHKVAVALLDAALRNYQSLGMAACAVDFESFNPEAASFWPRYFKPVCFSLLRIPEN